MHAIVGMAAAHTAAAARLGLGGCSLASRRRRRVARAVPPGGPPRGDGDEPAAAQPREPGATSSSGPDTAVVALVGVSLAAYVSVGLLGFLPNSEGDMDMSLYEGSGLYERADEAFLDNLLNLPFAPRLR